MKKLENIYLKINLRKLLIYNIGYAMQFWMGYVEDFNKFSRRKWLEAAIYLQFQMWNEIIVFQNGNLELKSFQMLLGKLNERKERK